ncbi:class IV adenylate cyclase [Streptomyces sp. NBC_01476]|uniref:class IV adenylate cyclase n=1 Tax=Streptomyces sp. NBC_01476 TaxID=2903881 RepID=UPI002E337463|nr:class IV adenylate cyclase [Streptomyces sp. NBC_01476]
MTIEAELKARVRDPERVHALLEERAAGRPEVYQDAYYDTADQALSGSDRELRVRTIHGADDTRSLLTYKGARVDEASGSKPEHETRVEDPAAVHATLRGLGYVPFIQFEKRCRNYDFEARGRQMLATLVRVPEIDGDFIELETIVEEDQLQDALADVRAVLGELGIDAEDLTTDTYTDAVATSRTR